MPYEIIIAVGIGLLGFVQVLLRTNAGIVFLSLCAGSLLYSEVGSEASLFLSSVIKNGDLSRLIASVSLLLLPAIVSALILRKSVSAGKSVINFMPAVAGACLVALLVIPFIPGEVRTQLTANILWDTLERFEPFIIVVGITSSILLLWLTKTKNKKDKKRK